MKKVLTFILILFLGICFGGLVVASEKATKDECVAKCRAKVAGFLGEDKAKEFDSI